MNSNELNLVPGSSPEAEGTIEVIHAKLHGCKITECALDYHGSVTIDQDIMDTAGLIPLEFVYIWNKASGARISTYVLPGERGAGTICLNGAAARTCQIGDEVIISASRRIKGTAAVLQHRPKILTFTHHPAVNRIDAVLVYEVSRDEKGWKFQVKPLIHDKPVGEAVTAPAIKLHAAVH